MRLEPNVEFPLVLDGIVEHANTMRDLHGTPISITLSVVHEYSRPRLGVAPGARRTSSGKTIPMTSYVKDRVYYSLNITSTHMAPLLPFANDLKGKRIRIGGVPITGEVKQGKAVIILRGAVGFILDDVSVAEAGEEDAAVET